MIPQVGHFIEHFIFSMVLEAMMVSLLLRQPFKNLVLTRSEQILGVVFLHHFRVFLNFAVQFLNTPGFLPFRARENYLFHNKCEARIFTSVANNASLFNFIKAISVAIVVNVITFLPVTTGCALIPKFLATTAPEPGVTCFDSASQRFAIHIRKHYYSVSAHVLNNSRHQAFFVKFNFREINLHYILTSIPLSRRYSFTS